MQPVLVSVLLPVRNSGATVASAIRSILAQTLGEFELIILVEPSEDDTAEVVKRFTDPRIRIVYGDTVEGLSKRLNQGVDAARGVYIARIDGDDIAYPDRLKRQVAYLANHPEVDLVGGWVVVFQSNGAPLGVRSGPEEHGDICRRGYSGIPIAHPTFLGRREFFRKYRYDEAYWRSEDQELLLRTKGCAHFANVPSVVLGYREDRLKLRYILESRYLLGRCAWRGLSAEGRRDKAIMVIGLQLAKCCADVLASASGLERQILKHRKGRPIREDESAAWANVWHDFGACV